MTLLRIVCPRLGDLQQLEISKKRPTSQQLVTQPTTKSRTDRLRRESLEKTTGEAALLERPVVRELVAEKLNEREHGHGDDDMDDI